MTSGARGMTLYSRGQTNAGKIVPRSSLVPDPVATWTLAFDALRTSEHFEADASTSASAMYIFQTDACLDVGLLAGTAEPGNPRQFRFAFFDRPLLQGLGAEPE